MHILDNKANEKTLSDVDMNLDAKTEQLIKKHIANSVNDEYVRLAKFEGEINVVKTHCQNMIANDEFFVNSSKEIANYLFDVMADRRISPAYLVLSKAYYEKQNYISLLKLDFNENLVSEVTEIDGKKRIDIKVQGMGLPNARQKLHKCVFFKEYDEDNSYDIILLDKQTREESEIADFFTNSFLHCKLAITDRDNTRKFSNHATRFIDENFGEDLERAMDLKGKLVSILKSDEKINLYSFAENTFGDDEELKANFIEYMTNNTIDVDFKIDKDWVELRIKRRKIITDSGIEIKIDEAIASNNEKFNIEYPYEDKNKADITIRNVAFTEEFIK